MTTIQTEDLKADKNQQVKVIRAIARGRIRRVINNAINWTAYDTRERVQKRMKKVFDQPTPYTVRGVIVMRSSQRTLNARVKLRDEATKGVAPERYLKWQARGGDRAAKRSEIALRKAGILLPGQYIAPGPGVRRNKYGNVSGATYTKMLSALGAHNDPHQNSPASRGWFLMRKGSRHGKRIAIAKRLKTKTKIMFWILDDAPNYERRFRFTRYTRATARRLFNERFDRALDRELRRG